MKKMHHFAFLLLLVVGCGDSGEDAAVLKFTAIPGDNTVRLQEKFAPFEKYLAEKLGVEVRYVPTTEYPASVEAFVKGTVHLAWFGGLTGVQARQRVKGARAIAQGKVDPEYHTYFIAHAGSGLEKSDEFPMALTGKKFTFGSNGSTSGRLMPEYFIRKHSGKSPEEIFGRRMSFSGSHEKTAQLVEAGTFDAGAIDYKTYDRLVAENRIDTEKCHVIWTTPPYADYNWTVHPDVETLFGTGFIGKLQKLLIEIRDPKLLEAVNRPEGMIEARNEEWNDLRDIAKELGLIR